MNIKTIICLFRSHKYTCVATERYSTTWSDITIKTIDAVGFYKCSRCGKRGTITTWSKYPNATHAIMQAEKLAWVKYGKKPIPITKKRPPSKNNTNLVILGLNPNKVYSARQIKTAWKKQALIHHPDSGGNTDTFIKITNAYKMTELERLTNQEIILKRKLDELQKHVFFIQDEDGCLRRWYPPISGSVFDKANNV